METKLSGRVIAAYQAPYADPIKAAAGDEIHVDRDKKTDIPGWVWCTDKAGKSGWTPEAYINSQGEHVTMRCDYDAIELTIEVGEILTLYKEESGFYWATNQAGQSGWAPAEQLEVF